MDSRSRSSAERSAAFATVVAAHLLLFLLVTEPRSELSPTRSDSREPEPDPLQWVKVPPTPEATAAAAPTSPISQATATPPESTSDQANPKHTRKPHSPDPASPATDT